MRMASYLSEELIPCAFVWLDPGITPCWKSRLSTGAEVSPNVGFQNSLIRQVWHRAVISRRYDRIGPLLVDGRGVLAPTAA
jgi:hypothetical protein